MKKSINFKLITSFIAIIGISIRIIVYFQNRSLTIDEANLARNIIEKSYFSLFEPLTYQQYSPPLFLLLVKFNTDLIGINELALKLVPLIGGILSILLFSVIVNKLVTENIAKFYTIMLFCLSLLSIRYATELKQYSTDTFVAILFIYYNLLNNTILRLKKILILSIIGSILIWFSMPTIFFLASISFTLLYKIFNKPRIQIILTIFPIATWATSFAIYYIFILKNDTSNLSLLNFHKEYFFKLIPNNLYEIIFNLRFFEGFLRTAIDKSTISIIWGLSLLIIGIYWLIKNNRFLAFNLICPIILTIFASSIQKYSLIERMTLFLLPSILIIIGFGFSFLWQKSNKYLKSIFLILIFVGAINKKSIPYIWNKMEFEDIKSSMFYLKNNLEPDAALFIHHDAYPAFLFYNNLHENAFHFRNNFELPWDMNPTKIIIEKCTQSHLQTFYILFSHTTPEEKEKYLILLDSISNPKNTFYYTIGSSTHGFCLSN